MRQFLSQLVWVHTLPQAFAVWFGVSYLISPRLSRVPLSEMCTSTWGDTWEAPLFMASPPKTLGYYYRHDHCCRWFCCAGSGCCYYYTLWPLPASPLYFLSVFPIQCSPGRKSLSPACTGKFSAFLLLPLLWGGQVTTWRGCCRGEFKPQTGTGRNEIPWKVPLGSKIPSDQQSGQGSEQPPVRPSRECSLTLLCSPGSIPSFSGPRWGCLWFPGTWVQCGAAHAGDSSRDRPPWQGM